MPFLFRSLAAIVAFAACARAQDLVLAQSDFSSGTSLDPFYECTYKSPSYAKAVNGELETFFDESNYDGTRDDRGVEICADTRHVTRELWHGFSFLLPSDYPSDKQSIIAQAFCLGGCTSWCGTLQVEGNSLRVDHRYACAATATTTVTIVDAIPLEKWNDVVINARFSLTGQGHYTVYWNGNKIYDAQGIKLGFDAAWADDGSMTTGVGFKNGQYNSDTSKYTNGTRTIYFDNISWYNVDDGQTDGYAVVSP